MNKLPFEIFLALRYLRPKRTFVSIITLISVIGVMLGVAVLIIVISVMSGFDHELRQKFLGFDAHIQLSRHDAPISNYRELMHQIQTVREVKGVAPFVISQVLVETQPKFGNPRIIGPMVKGVDPEREGEISNIPGNMIAGKFDVENRGVVVGREFARAMQVGVGDYLSIYSAEQFTHIRKAVDQINEGQKGIEIPLPDDFEIRGIFDVGYYNFNEAFLLCALEDAQAFFNFVEEDLVHGMMINLHDPDQAGIVARNLEEELGPAYMAQTWLEKNGTILDALVVEKNVMFYLLFFIMVVAAFGITSALITFVVQKTREIGMLKALGATTSQVVWLFLSQSLAVGVMGVIAGFGLGMTALHYRNEFLVFMRRITGFELFPAEIYNFSQLPALIVPSDIVAICGGSLVICLIAGMAPAWNAGRLHPVEALRHD